MSQQLILEVNDAVYSALQQRAVVAGISPNQVAVAALEQQLLPGNGQVKTGKDRTEAEKQAARERYERHFGVFQSHDPHSSDNEKIDADLGREYADNHEDA